MRFVTRDDVRLVLREAIRHSATRVGIDPGDAGDLTSLYEAILDRDPLVFHALETFLQSYVAWVSTHEAIDAAGSAGNLSAEQATELGRRIDDRKASAAALASLLRG